MKSLLLLSKIQIKNANASTDLTYGFPATSHFLGFTHKLSRHLSEHLKTELIFKGCGIVCHDYQLHAKKMKYGEIRFSQSRNPLNFNGKTASFIEEEKMDLVISLLIECDFDDEDFESLDDFKRVIRETIFTFSIAGGKASKVEDIEHYNMPSRAEAKADKTNLIKRKLLPGFALIERSDLLACRQREQPQNDIIDHLLSFCSLTYKAERIATRGSIDSNKGQLARWHLVPNPETGWFVPILAGYRAISDLHPPGTVSNARDQTVPCRFVESIYTLGEWISPHRIKDIQNILWSYHYQDDFYLIKNNYYNI